VRDVRLADKAADLLAQKRFAIVPDPEHLRQLAELQPGHPAVARIREMTERPAPVAVLTGTNTGPDIRFDRPFMSARGTDPAGGARPPPVPAPLRRDRPLAQEDPRPGRPSRSFR
jgi:L-asparagine oxygenase